jgi:tetratricopeptide (TPR) repeat protein
MSLGAVPENTSREEKLGSDDPAVWQRAETELQAEGAAAKDTLTRLAKHPDPWVAARAGRLLMALNGIDARLPRHRQLAILGYDDLDEAARAELLEAISRPGPGHLSATLFLYEKAHAGADANAARQWQQRLRSAIASNPGDVEALKHATLSPAALALLLSSLPDNPPGTNAQRYKAWRKINTEIRFHLIGTQVELEIAILREKGGSAALLGYLAEIRDAEARIHAARFIRGLVMADRKLAPDSLDAKASIGHLLTLASDSGATEWYGKHLARHPDIAASFPPELTPLTIRHLMDQGKFSEAIRLFLAPQDGNWPERGVDWNLIREIGASLGSDPAALPDGFPEINESSRLPVMGRILDAWFTASRGKEENAAPGGKVECFDRWAGNGEWLEAAHRHGALQLYQQAMIRREKFVETLILHESDRNLTALANLGQIIAARPELAPLVPAGRCSVETLRSLLHGAVSDYGFAWRDPKPQPAFDLAAAWQEIHPTLLEKGSFSTQPLYQAALDWKAGRRAEAATALLAITKPIITEYGGRTHSNSNPIASHAIAMLADLLATSPDADFNTLLPADAVTKETLVTILGRFGKRKDQTPADIRMSLAVSTLIRERFDPDGTDFAIDAYEARRIALDAWIAGDDALAGDILITSFLSNPDKDEHFDGGVAWALALLGRAEEAIEKLDSAKASIPEPVHLSKRARLLQVLGRTKEAMETVSPEHQPHLRLALALETQDWDAALSAAAAAMPENSASDPVRSCIGTLSGNPELLKRHANSNLGTIRLLYGDSLREEDLPEMARDAEIAAKCERILAEALGSGAPVPYMQLSQYLQYPDLIPDKSRAIQLTTEIAAKDSIIINGEPLAGAHRIPIAASLLNLGRGDLAYTAMRPLFATSLREKPATALKKSYGWGYSFNLTDAFNVVLRLTQMEWPDLPTEKQMENLDAALADKEPLDRARNMLGLIQKHHAKFDKNELHQALWLPLFDLSHSGEVTDEFKSQALAMMDAKQPGDDDRKRLANAWTRELWFMESHHPPGGNGMQYEFGYNPKAGKKDKPRSKDFALLDGLASAHRLLGQKQPEAAGKLIRECVMRNLLDPDLTDQRVHWNTKEGGGWGSGRGLISGGSSTLLVFFESYDLPPEICLPLIRACTDTWNNTSDDIRFLHAANYLSAHGSLREALGLYHRFLVATSGVTGSGIAGRPHVAAFYRTRSLLAAQNGNGAAAVEDMRRLVQLAPYKPENAAQVISTLRKNGDQESLAAARDVIEQFWRVRLIGIPASRTYAHWRKQWAALFP